MSTSSSKADIVWKDRKDLTILNHDQERLDGPGKVTGHAKYSHDIRIPGMVYGRLVLVPYSRTKLSKVDVSKAAALDGVVHAEVWDGGKEAVQFLGDDSVVAVVAAESPELAEDAARAVLIEFEPEDNPMVTRAQVVADDAPNLRQGRRGGPNVTEGRARGDEEDVDELLAMADGVVEQDYSVPIQHHVCLETHGCVVHVDGDKATVYPSTQMVSDSVGMYASMLDMSQGDVRVICQNMGGGFGSKFGAGLEGLAACRLALAVERPVHLMLNRRQEFIMSGNRSGSTQSYHAGASKDGKIVALKATAEKYGGMGGGSLPTPPYIYKVKKRFAQVGSVYTALDSNRAMRAPGHPQASFGMESVVDELAYSVKFDPLLFRQQNLDSEVHVRQLERVAKEIGWNQHPNRLEPGEPDEDGMAEGIGFGVSQWGAGARPGAHCEVRIEADGSVTSSVAVQDLGTGSRTYVAGIVAEELGLPLTGVTAKIGDSDLPSSVASGGSVTTGSQAPAIQDAAVQARRALEAKLVDAIGGELDAFTWKGGEVTSTAGKKLSFRDACALLGGESIIAMGEFKRNLHSGGAHGAQAARVRVDTLTGHVQVIKMVCMQDMGLPLNRAAVRSQMNGGMIGALSYGLFEERILDEDFGFMLSDQLEDYKIAGMQEMPEMVSIIDDDDDFTTTKGVAEATGIPGHSAIANAIYNACGARVRHLPMTPDKVLAALGRS
jgi:xanthine dehydrogenase YagR molybdenum-binding subunit